MIAPHWVANGAAVHYVTRGKGRVEITYPDGRQALRHDAKQGDVIVIPAGFAHATVGDRTKTLSCCDSKLGVHVI